MKRFYSEKDVKTIAATAATTATVEATAAGQKKAIATGGIGVIIGAAITFTAGRSYCKKIEEAATKSNASLKKDIRVLKAGIEEADKKFTELKTDISQLPAFVEARKLINEKGGMKLPDQKEEDKKKKEDNKKKENNKKKGGDK